MHGWAFMKRFPCHLVVGVLAAAITSGCLLSARTHPVGVYYATESEVYVNAPMPAPRVEVVTVAPAPGMLWVDGYWGWSGHAYAWNAGRWSRPSRPGYVWVAPRYQTRGGRHVYIRGRWAAPRATVRGSVRAGQREDEGHGRHPPSRGSHGSHGQGQGRGRGHGR